MKTKGKGLGSVAQKLVKSARKNYIFRKRQPVMTAKILTPYRFPLPKLQKNLEGGHLIWGPEIKGQSVFYWLKSLVR